MAACGTPLVTSKASLPPDPPTDIQRCDAEPDWPDPATLPKNDARPGIALLEQGVYAGRDCRTVVAGWVAWWACQKAVVADPKVKCDALAEVVKGLRKGRGESPDKPNPSS